MSILETTTSQAIETPTSTPTPEVITPPVSGPQGVESVAPVADKVSSDKVSSNVTLSLKDMLADDLKVEKSLADFKDVNGLAKSYLNAQKMLGNSIRIPSAEASEEAFNEFYSKLESVKGVMRAPDTTNPDAMKDFYAKLGRPSAPESYKFELQDSEAESLGLKDDLAAFKKFSYDMGLTNDQANALAKGRIEAAIKQREVNEAAVRQAEQVLKQKWGVDFDNRIQGAKLAVNYLSDQFPAEVKGLLEGSNGNNPLLINILSEYGRNLVETGALKNSSSVKYGISREEAANIISDIANNPKHLANSPIGTPGREDALAERARLAKIAFEE